MGIGTAAAVLGSAAIGAVSSSRASSKAARAQERATQEAAAVQREALARQEELSRPFRETGIEAQNALARMAGIGPDTGAPDYGVLGRPFGENELVVDPGYGFRLKEGMRDLDRRLAAGGRMFSGGALKAGQQYGQELASQEYQNAFTRAMELRMQRGNALSGLYGGGLQAAMGFGQDVGQSARNVGDLVTSGGAARASGYVGQANALNQALGAGTNYLMQQDLLNRIYPTGGAGGAVIPGTSAGAGGPVYAGLPRMLPNIER
jgi:hypothetical protein